MQYERTKDNVMNSILNDKSNKKNIILNKIHLGNNNNYRNIFVNCYSIKKRNDNDNLPNINSNKYNQNIITEYNNKQKFQCKKRIPSGIPSNIRIKQYYIKNDEQINAFNLINNNYENYFNNKDKNNIFDMFNKYNPRNNIIQKEGGNVSFKNNKSNYYNNKSNNMININILKESNININKSIEENNKLNSDYDSSKKELRNINDKNNQYINEPYNKYKKNLFKSHNHRKNTIFSQSSINIINNKTINNNNNFNLCDPNYYSITNHGKGTCDKNNIEPIKIENENLENINKNISNQIKELYRGNKIENKYENNVIGGNALNEIRNYYDKKYEIEDDNSRNTNIKFNEIKFIDIEKESDNNNKDVEVEEYRNFNNYITDDEKVKDSKKNVNNNDNIENKIEYIDVFDDENIDNKEDKENSKKKNFDEGISIDEDDIQEKSQNKNKENNIYDINDEDNYNGCNYIIDE